jgi:hypothetical protein
MFSDSAVRQVFPNEKIYVVSELFSLREVEPFHALASTCAVQFSRSLDRWHHQHNPTFGALAPQEFSGSFL